MQGFKTFVVFFWLMASCQAMAELQLYFVHNDHLGTPLVVTDAEQKVVWQGEKTPFGETTEVVSGVDMPIRFPGQYYDEESGLHYNYYRDYDPSLGRYVQSDPIGLDGGVNTYGYVKAAPILLTDFYGLAPDYNFHDPQCVGRRAKLNPYCFGREGHEAANNIPDDNECITASGHGNPEEMYDYSDGYSKPIDMNEFAKKIRSNEKYDPNGGNCIILYACHAGDGPGSPANKLDEALGGKDNVYGHDDYISVTEDGRVAPGPDVYRRY